FGKNYGIDQFDTTVGFVTVRGSEIYPLRGSESRALDRCGCVACKENRALCLVCCSPCIFAGISNSPHCTPAHRIARWIGRVFIRPSVCRWGVCTVSLVP